MMDQEDNNGLFLISKKMADRMVIKEQSSVTSNIVTPALKVIICSIYKIRGKPAKKSAIRNQNVWHTNSTV
jgi:hypothetical protein